MHHNLPAETECGCGDGWMDGWTLLIPNWEITPLQAASYQEHTQHTYSLTHKPKILTTEIY